MGAADRLVPCPADLPGTGWRTVDLDDGGTEMSAVADVLPVVGADFPAPDEIQDSASSPYFVRRNQLVHGLAVVFTSVDAARRALAVLGSRDFAARLAVSVAADLAGGGNEPEILTADVTEEGPPFRAGFVGVGPSGALPVHLDVVAAGAGPAVTLLWFADAPDPFDPDARDVVVGRLADRLARGAADG